MNGAIIKVKTDNLKLPMISSKSNDNGKQKKKHLRKHLKNKRKPEENKQKTTPKESKDNLLENNESYGEPKHA